MAVELSLSHIWFCFVLSGYQENTGIICLKKVQQLFHLDKAINRNNANL